VLAIGLLARAILLPITHGQDFTVWDLASRATLRGVNIYAHHPAYTGGPFAYFPLFLYMELPMQWLALHTGIPFTVLGKLPIMAGDVLTTGLMVREVRRRSAGPATQAVAAALFFLNPLVLYNGAFYGRFDSVCLALLMFALVGRQSARRLPWRRAFGYASAVAVKTFPIFLLPWLLRRDRDTATRVVVSCGVVLLVTAAPYLVTSPAAFVGDQFYNAGKLPNGLSWQVAFNGLPAPDQAVIADLLLGVFLAAAIIVTFVDDELVAAAGTLLLFLVFSKQVIEQYLVWPLPFVVVLALGGRSRPAWWLIGELTLAGGIVNAYVHPFGQHPLALSIVFAVAVSAATLRLLAPEARRGRARQGAERWSAEDTTGRGISNPR